MGEEIKTYAQAASPGGAQKLTAESLGVLIHAVNQMLRTQATMLKLQAETLALKNREDKELVRRKIDDSHTLAQAMGSLNTDFKLPDFNSDADSSGSIGGLP